MAFELNETQIKNLNEWKNFLFTSKSKEWTEYETEGIEEVHEILKNKKFSEGNDLTEDELDKIFRSMKKLMSNRALARNLYEKNGLKKFNKCLRELYHGKFPFPDRIEQFVSLEGIAEYTLSHFLCVFDPEKYALVSNQTLEVLDLEGKQEEAAWDEVEEEYGESVDKDLLWSTESYLLHGVIFEKIKNHLVVENYSLVNQVLWHVYELEGGIEAPTEALESISIEKDLRKYLAKNPEVIEEGLELVQEEFRTNAVGNIDLLLRDKKDWWVVVELKKGQEDDKVLGQLQRYMGWVKKNKGKEVRGIIIVSEPTDELMYALEVTENIKLKTYKVIFEIHDF